MHLNIAVCDDEQVYSHMLQQLLTTYSMDNSLDIHVDLYPDGESLLAYYQNPRHITYQLLLLDIEMPGMNGIQVAGHIRKTIDSNVIIVFISNYPEYMHDSFSVHPYHFLQKPVNASAIHTLMNDILLDYQRSHSLISIIDGTDREYTIQIQDIYYIKCVNSKKKQLTFYMPDFAIETKGILSAWDKKLSKHGFTICSRTIIVNLSHVHYIKENEIILDNGNAIPISKRNKKAIMDQFLNQVVAINHT